MMNVNELMIGDWVHMEAHRGFEAQDIKVETIPDEHKDYEGIGCHYGHIGAWPKSEDNDFRDIEETHLSPIGITKDILEANGLKVFKFMDIEGQHQWTWWVDTLTHFSLWTRELNDDTKDGWMIRVESPLASCCFRVDYIHQLQHVLRICNIDKEIILQFSNS